MEGQIPQATSVATTASILSTSGGVAGRDVCLLVDKPLTTNTVMSTSIAPTTGGPPSTNRATSESPSMYTSSTVMTQSESDANVVSPSGDGSSAAASTNEASSATSIAPTTGGREESGPNAGLVAGVVVGVVLAVVVVVVVVTIVLAVCSTQQRRKRSGQTCDVPVVALSVADDNGIALIRNPAYDELKNLTSSANEASSVQYDYAHQTGIAPGAMGHEPSAHDAVLLTPMYEPMSDTSPAKVSI